MSEVIVRQWGPDCYAAYVVRSGAYPEFVGTDETREGATELAESRCGPRVSGVSEQVLVAELGGAQRERLQRSTAGLDPNPDLTRK